MIYIHTGDIYIYGILAKCIKNLPLSIIAKFLFSTGYSLKNVITHKMTLGSIFVGSHKNRQSDSHLLQQTILDELHSEDCRSQPQGLKNYPKH